MADTERINIVVSADDNATSVLNNVRGSLMGLGRGINSLNSGLRQYNSAMAGINRMMINVVKEAGAAIYDFTSESIDNFTELSEQHAKTLGAMANNYDKTLESQQKFMEQSEQLKQQAIDMSKYGVTINGVTSNGSLASPVEVSAAQTSLAKAGVNADAMINTDVVSEIVQFAKANDLGTEESVSFAVALGNQFGYDYSQWGEMLDKVSHTADLAPIGVQDVVQSMKYASGISSGLDRPMEETLAEIAVLGNFGLRGTQAGSGIQALLTRILTGDTTVITQAQAEVAPPKALEAFYNFSNYAKSSGSNITYDDILNETFTEEDITGNLRPMDDVLDALEQQMAELNDEEQAWFAKKLFGLYQMKSAYALINGDENDSSLNDIIKEIQENSDGTNSNKLAELLNSQSGKIQSTRNLIEGIKTDLGQMLEPTVSAVLGEFQSFLKDPNNYNINWDNIRNALDESCDAIEEVYGTVIADAVRNLGGLTIDLGQVVENVAPEFMEGMVGVLNATISGNFFGEDGVGANWDEMISNMHTSLQELPPELQELGEKVVDVIDLFGKLATLNIATTIAQLVTSVMQIAMMTVHAASVVVNSTGGLVNNGAGTSGAAGAGAAGSAGTSGAAGAGAAASLSGSTIVGSADDVAKALGTTTDDVIATLGEQATYSIDDIAKGLGSTSDDVIRAFSTEIDDVVKAGAASMDDVVNGSTSLFKSLSGFGKGLGALATLWQLYSTGKEAITDFSAGDTKGGVEAIAGGASSMGGGYAGAAIGTAIAPGPGTIIGAIIGALGGDYLGRNVAGAVYDDFDYGTTGIGLYDNWRRQDREDDYLYEQMQQNAQPLIELAKALSEAGVGGLNRRDWALQLAHDNGIEYYDQKLNGNERLQFQQIYSEVFSPEAWEMWNDRYNNQNVSQETINELAAQIVRISKEDESYNASYDPGNGYYDVWTGTQEELRTYLNNMGPSFVSQDYNHGKGAFDNPYLMDEVDKETQDAVSDKVTTSIDGARESIDGLNETISNMAVDQQTPTINWAETIPGFYAMSEKGQQQAIQAYLDNEIMITPQFSMEAPQVSVSVTVDGNGNILSQKQSILNPGFNTTINSWYQRIASQNGGTTK